MFDVIANRMWSRFHDTRASIVQECSLVVLSLRNKAGMEDGEELAVKSGWKGRYREQC